MPAPNTAAEIGREAVDRMVEFVRRSADQYHAMLAGMNCVSAEMLAEARAIVALLPKLVDSDLIEAREVVKATLDPASHKACHCRDEIDAGEWDKGQKVRSTLAGIKRGRELALKARAVGEGEK